MKKNFELYQSCFHFILETGDFLNHRQYQILGKMIVLEKIRQNAQIYFSYFANEEEQILYIKKCNYKFTGKYAYDFYVYGQLFDGSYFFEREPAFFSSDLFYKSLTIYLKKYASKKEKRTFKKIQSEYKIILPLFDEFLNNPKKIFPPLDVYHLENKEQLLSKISFYIGTYLKENRYPEILEKKKVLVSQIYKIEENDLESAMIHRNIVLKEMTMYKNPFLVKLFFERYIKEAPLTKLDFCNKYGISTNRFKAIEKLYKQNYGKEYLLLIKELEKNKLDKEIKWDLKIKKAIGELHFGIAEEEGIRPFDFLDFVPLFPYPLHEIRMILSSKKIEDFSTFMNILLRSAQINMEQRLKTNTFYHNKEVMLKIGREDKMRILFWLVEKNVPIYAEVFDAAIQRYCKQVLINQENNHNNHNKKMELK